MWDEITCDLAASFTAVLFQVFALIRNVSRILRVDIFESRTTIVTLVLSRLCYAL